jgi:hypothetical protein
VEHTRLGRDARTFYPDTVRVKMPGIDQSFVDLLVHGP